MASFAEYWVNAIAAEPEGRHTKLITYNSCSSISDCDKVINTWVNDYNYKLIISWLEVDYGSGCKQIIHKKEYLNNYAYFKQADVLKQLTT